MLAPALATSTHSCRERPGDQRPVTGHLSEADLVVLWAGQRLPAAALVTREGVALRVLHPGWRGRGPGPDFRAALIALPSGRLLRGDVELHTRASDFRAHGHERDRRYDAVVLHVVFEDDTGGGTRLRSGRAVPVIALGAWARRRARELAGWLESPPLWREPCHDAVLRLGREEVLGRLDAVGQARFAERQALLSAALEVEGAAGALYGALAAALVYGDGRQRLAALTARLPWPELAARLEAAAPGRRVLVAEALLLGAAGLLPSRPVGAATHPYEEELERAWRGGGLRAEGGAPAATPGPFRPANHPARRVAGLARLLARHGPDLAALPPPDPRAARLIAAWSVPAEGYWRERLAPGAGAGRGAGALVGRGRAVELLVNAVLPWWAARAEAAGDGAAGERARACFAALPRPGAYGRLAFLEANLRGGDGPLPLNARRQQGLLALHKTECTQGGCGRCPLS